MSEPGRGLCSRRLSYSSSSAVSSRKSSSNDTTSNVDGRSISASNINPALAPSHIAPTDDHNNNTTTIITTTTSGSSSNFHGDGADVPVTINRTRKLSVVSFTSAEYNRNDDQWEEEAVTNTTVNTTTTTTSDNNNNNNTSDNVKRAQRIIAEEIKEEQAEEVVDDDSYDYEGDSSHSPSSGYTTSSSSTTSSSQGCCTDSAHQHGPARNTNGRKSADREKRRRRARDRKLLRNQQGRRPAQNPQTSHASTDRDGMLLHPQHNHQHQHQQNNQHQPYYGPALFSSCYGGGGGRSPVSSQSLSFLRQHASCSASRSPPNLFRASTPKQLPDANLLPSGLPLLHPAAGAVGSAGSAAFYPRPIYGYFPGPLSEASSSSSPPSSSSLLPLLLSPDPNPNRDADNTSPFGFHRHSLTTQFSRHLYTSIQNDNNSNNNNKNNNKNILGQRRPNNLLHPHHPPHHDQHLHKRRRRLDYDLPGIHLLTPPPPPPPPRTSPAPARKGLSHSHSLSATSAAELLSSTSLHTPPPADPSQFLQPSPIRPSLLNKGRSLSTPAGGADEFYSPLQSICASPVRPAFFTDVLRDRWDKQFSDGCLVYDMVVAPSTQTFSVPRKSKSPPSVAPPTDLSPAFLKALAVPIRDSPPETLRSVFLLEVLANDPRPTFLLGTASTTDTKESQLSSTTIHELKIEVVYHNDAFSSLLPDEAFSTTVVEPGCSRTTFNITDPRYHRWISSSFANTSIGSGKCRPYVCPDGILWTQNAFTCPDGSRMVLICGVPLPSTATKQVEVRKGETCPPHAWETAMEAMKLQEPQRDDNNITTLVSDAQPSVADPGTPSIGVMGQLNGMCSTPACPSIGRTFGYEDAEQVPESSYLEAKTVPNYYTQVEKEMDSDMIISPASTPVADPPETEALSSDEENKPVTEDMDVSDDTIQAKNHPAASTVYSPHLPSDYGFFDWTRLPPEVVSDSHIELVRAIDWSLTGFGAIETWPQSLRTMINLVLSSPHPAAMYWGPEFSIVYNEAYIPLIGSKHPWLLGQKYKDGWSEIWDGIEPFFMEAVRTGKPTNKEDDRLFILRNGFREETYFSWSICPIIGEDGTTIGLHNPAFEKTRRVIAERRMLTLREVGERCGSARDVKSFWGYVLAALETNPWDAPFAVLYSCKRADATDSEVSSAYASSLSNTRVYSLEGTIGVPEGHPAAPAMLDLKANAGGFSIAFREALQIEGNIYLSLESGTLPADLMDGINFQGFSDDMCTSAVVCPINTSSDTPLGFLVLGINPRRPFDEDYRLFIQLLARQLTTSVASVVLFEEEIRRSQRAARLAALDRVELSNQLAVKSKEAEHSELKFTRLAEFAPVGVFIADFQGKISYYNDMFSEISCHPKELDVSRWLESVHPVDAAKTEANWNEVIHGKKRMTWEFRWKTPWMLPNHLGEQVERWTLFSASPELDSDGMLLGVFGSITNISETKFAEDLQKRRVEEVVELKRQQDNFVDMASHEMRNPLSAILQGADAVLGSLERYREMASSQDLLQDIESSIDVAQTISLCALHQKRVVDDILTMSKLDSALLTVTPVDVQPISVVEKAFKMFEQEAISSETKMSFKVDDSYRNLAVDWVKLDPARLLQVLINLLTNALKFLRTEPSKSIIVTMGASDKQPSFTDQNNTLVYFSSTRKAVDLTVGPDWGNGESVFLTFSVLDTGKGLTEAEKKNLFQKFSQATAKTEVSYGGSGLGLFICKELVHLQSGEIGVQSEAGKGCVFSFYIKCRRSSRPEVEIPQAPVLRPAAPSERRAGSQGLHPPPSPVNDLSFEVAKNSGLPKSSKRSSEEKQNLDYKVLIVEDNLVNQKLLRKALENSGCTTYVANHGKEALDRIEQSVFWKGAQNDAHELSLILMDVEMPVMDGLTCSRKIRELQAEGSILGHIPIIAVTANARQAQIDRMFAAGMDDVVSKPYRIKELIPKLHSVVSRHRESSAIEVGGG